MAKLAYRRQELLKVDEREQIRRAHFIDGKSIRQIAREGHHHRRTVREAIQDPAPSHYTLHDPRPRPVLGPYTPVIDRWLAQVRAAEQREHHRAANVNTVTGDVNTVTRIVNTLTEHRVHHCGDRRTPTG